MRYIIGGQRGRELLTKPAFGADAARLLVDDMTAQGFTILSIIDGRYRRVPLDRLSQLGSADDGADPNHDRRDDMEERFGLASVAG